LMICWMMVSIAPSPVSYTHLDVYKRQAARRWPGAVSYTHLDVYKRQDWDFSGIEQFARFGVALGLDIANLPELPARIKP